MKVNVFNLILFDESGSMESIRKPAIESLNETLQSIQRAQRVHQEYQKHFVTLVCFNAEGIKTIYDVVPVEEIRMIGYEDYQPNNCTPLYDAMGSCLSKLRCQLNSSENNQVLVTIITDGYENASKEYDKKMIRHLVKELQNSGWVFVYIGANQDVDAVADSLSIHNKLFFIAEPDNVRKMMVTERSSRANFYDKISTNLFDSGMDLQRNFFENDSRESFPTNKSAKSVIAVVRNYLGI